jgi:Ni,Fe-hydrogenase maturation factor
MKRIYVCGNEMVPEDSMPLRILPYLKDALPEVEFLPFDPSENFPDDDPLYIIDAVLNIDRISVIEDIEKLEDSPRVSVHDSDLGFLLKWMKKLGRLPKIIIFGVPALGSEKELGEELVAKIGGFIST